MGRQNLNDATTAVKGSEQGGPEKGAIGKEGRRGGGHPLGNIPTPSRGGRGGRDREQGGGDASRRQSSHLEEVMRRKGVDEAWTALEEMQSSGVSTDKFTVSRMLMKTVGDSRTRLNAPRVYRAIALVERFTEVQPRDVDEVLFNALLDTCCRLKDLERVETTVQRMRSLRVTPSPVTLGILVKTYGQAGDLTKVLQVWEEMEQQRGQASAVTYGCMIDACVKCGHLDKAVEVFDGMRGERKHRNTILYTTLIKGYGLEKDLPNALKLFREMAVEEVPYNTITYNSVIDACIKSGDVAQAEILLREMMGPECTLEPDLITFSTLLKGYCHLGELDKALQMAQTITARGLRCDELVYNTLMDGCSKANDITAGVGLFEEMVNAGLRPSAITHSILMRLHQRADYEDDATEAVAQLYQHHGLERPNVADRGRAHSGFSRRGSNRSSPCSPGLSLASESPLASPMSGFGTLSSMAQCAGGWGELPLLPNFGSEPPSGATTPCPSPPATPFPSPEGGFSGPYVPIEQLQRHHMPVVPPFPGGSSTSSDTPFGGVSCTTASSTGLSPFLGGFMGTPMPDGVNHGAQPSMNAFAMPVAPEGMQGGIPGHVQMQGMQGMQGGGMQGMQGVQGMQMQQMHGGGVPEGVQGMQMQGWQFHCGGMPGHMQGWESPMAQGYTVVAVPAGPTPAPPVGGGMQSMDGAAYGLWGPGQQQLGSQEWHAEQHAGPRPQGHCGSYFAAGQ